MNKSSKQELLDDMRDLTQYANVASMPIPLYERIKEYIKADQQKHIDEQQRILKGLARAYKILCNEEDKKVLYDHPASWYAKAQILTNSKGDKGRKDNVK